MTLQQLSDTKTILLVDDDPGILEVVGHCLELLDISVCTASSGKEALEMMKGRKTPYDLIISDVCMPFMHGWSLIQNISNLLGRNECPPIIVMTGHAELEKECLENPDLSFLVAGILTKPFSKKHLHEIVRDILKLPCESLSQVS